MYLKTNDISECVGCNACINICPKNCIHTYIDEEGFSYPKIDYSQCINCHLCEDTCPVTEDPIEVNANKIIYALKNKDKHVRNASSSGGAFSAFAEQCLEESGIVYATVFESDFSVSFMRITRKDDIELARKSKYVQSDLNETHKLIRLDLLDNKKVLFVGTSCQVKSILTYIECLHLDKSRFVTIDILCHGVSSPMIWREYLNYMENIQGSSLTKVNFRSKGNGWAPLMIKLEFESGLEYEKKSNEDGFYRLFFGHYIIRPSCHSCRFTSFDRVSDITIADFWGIDKILPDFYDTNGVSMVFLNSGKGIESFKRIKESIDFEEINSSFHGVLYKVQPNLHQPSTANRKRDDFWKYYEKYGFEKSYKKYGQLTTVKKKIDKIKNMIVYVLNAVNAESK